jgi:AcrR family transcriptional regulator
VSAPDFERARTAEAKQVREAAILDAATRLATADGVRAVTLTDIAAAVGMHKSTMLRYFETREEIFLRLAARHWVQWSQTVTLRLAALGPAPVGPRPLERRVAAVARIVAESLTDQPLFCDLLAHTPLNLERGVSFEAVRTFKIVAVAASRSVAAALSDALPLTKADAGATASAATALAGAYWQMAAPGTELRRFYERTPELAHAVVDVAPRVADALTAMVRGYLAAPTSR